MTGDGSAAGAGAPLLSVVVPTLNEESRLPALLADLAGLRTAHEVIVSDGGSVDGTVEVARAARARVVTGTPGRGVQLRRGADAARGPLLCFLHADVRVPDAALRLLDRMAGGPPREAAAFRLRIDAVSPIYRVLEAGANLRTRAFGMPYGDQGLVVSAEAYRVCGGHPQIPLMEDVEIARRLRRTVGIRLLDEEVRVSARRWESTGPIRGTILNLSLLGRYLLGAAPERLAARYGSRGSGDA